MLRELFEKLMGKIKEQDIVEWVDVPSGMSAQDKLQHADPRPCTFDANVEAWLYRIGTWGRLKFKHRDTMFGKSWKTITKSKFIKKLLDPEMLRLFGEFGIDLEAVNKVRVYREYQDLNNRRQVEEFLIEIILKPSLKKLLKG